MARLRWLALVPMTFGLAFLFIALTWTEWPQFFAGAALLAFAAIVWRGFAGEWPRAR